MTRLTHFVGLLVLTMGLFMFARTSSVLAAHVRIAAPAQGEPVSAHFTVSVDGQSDPVYVAHVKCISQISPEIQLDGQAGFTTFDMDRRSATVTVICDQPVQSVKLLPSSYGLSAKISGNSVSFRVNKPGQITVEVNGDWNNSLHVFANPLEQDIPKANDPNVIYFGPGVHTFAPMTVHSGQTVYIDDGAILYCKPDQPDYNGPIFNLSGSNIVLRGRGIIDGSLIPKEQYAAANMIVTHGSDIHIEGVTLRDSGTWNVPIQNSTNVTVKNIKIFGYRGNSDGIDINNSAFVDVSDCFFRTFDDDVVIKSSDRNAQDTHDVTAERCVLWNEIAHTLSLGAELNVGCENIKFSDCDIIHDKGREWLLRVFNSGAGAVKNVTFDNIRIEQARRPLCLWIGKTQWVQGGEQGHIDNVVFSNISSVLPDNGQQIATLTGFDTDHAIHNVSFINVVFGGKPISQSDITQNAFVSGVTIQPSN